MEPFTSQDEARKRHTELNTAWWNSYIKNGAAAPQTIKLQSECDELAAQAVKQFAKPQIADCKTCKRVSVFGGPGHNASPYCRSGKQPHCTCDTCW